MQVMPGMTQDQRKAAGNSYRQFQQRLFGNRPQSGGTMYAGGSKNFDERTGQYTQPPSTPVIGNAPNGRPVTGAYGSQPAPTKAPDMSAYGPGRAQPIQPSYGTPYPQPSRPANFTEMIVATPEELEFYKKTAYAMPGGPSVPSAPSAPRMPAQPVQQRYGSPYQPAPGYGGGYGPGGIRTAVFKDRDGDGVDDRDQAGPGMPAPGRGGAQMPPSQQPVYDRGPGGQMIAYPSPTRPPAVTGFPTYPAPVNGMIDGRPVAGKGRSPQEEIDRLKQMGTWDDPRNAKARERLEQRLNDYNTVPEGYFRTPDGRLEPDYLLRGGISSLPQPGMARPVQQRYGSPYQPQRGMHAQPKAAPPSFSPPPAAGPDFGQMFNFQGFAPAPPPPRPPEIAPAKADWYGPPGSFNGEGERIRVTQDFDFDERRRIDARIQRHMQERFPHRNPSDVPDIVRENITREEQRFTEQLRRERFAQPNAERDAAVAAQEAEYQQRLQQRYRGPGFTQQSIGWDGSVMSPQQNIAQRDAFIARLNAERAPLAATAGVHQTGMAPVAPPLNRDFASMWGQAGNMVANGWANPLAGLFG